MDNITRYTFGSFDTIEFPFSECLPHKVIWHSVGRKPSATVTTYSIEGRFVTIAHQSKEDMLAGGPSFLDMMVYNYTLPSALTEHQMLVRLFLRYPKILVPLSIQVNQEIQILSIIPLGFNLFNGLKEF